MRHNKLAGTRFLLGSRKHKPSSTFTTSSKDTTQNMLHSKSTYFYRWFRQSMDLVVSGLSAKTSYIVPAVCGAALLGALGLIVSPVIGNIETAYAAEEDKCKTSEDPNTGVCAMELALFMNGTDGAYNELPATELSTDNVVHRDYNFSVRAVDTKDGYDLYAGVVNTGSFGNNLVNADYPTEEHMIKALSGTDVSYNSIGNNEWGYAITSTNQSAEELSYNSLPVATITTEDDKTTLTNGKLLVHGEDTGYDPSQPVGEDKHTDQDYKLYFAAKASPDSPAGHYRTQVMLSLVANPKMTIGTLGGITKMSEMTSTYCKNLPSVTADMTKVPTGQLVDDRTGADGQKYWVSKLADGNCWMVQNLSYAEKGANVSKKSSILAPNSISNPTTYTEISIVGKEMSSDPSMVEAIDGNIYNAHYLIGGYYTFEQATPACSGKSGVDRWDWQVPTSGSNNSSNASFGKLADTYGMSNMAESSMVIRKAPFYFMYGGYNASQQIGSVGYYQSSTISSSPHGYMLSISSSGVQPAYDSFYISGYNSYSVRCLVSGA